MIIALLVETIHLIYNQFPQISPCLAVMTTTERIEPATLQITLF